MSKKKGYVFSVMKIHIHREDNKANSLNYIGLIIRSIN